MRGGERGEMKRGEEGGPKNVLLRSKLGTYLNAGGTKELAQASTHYAVKSKSMGTAGATP